jgi:ADP-ribose pyrophosphatase YjhB (NUDIX family)
MTCDHTSVGILVFESNKVLTIKRARRPFGYAPPAGHVDLRLNYEQAAKEELFEEVGLRCTNFELLIEGRLENHCRRKNGNWHYWKIYRASAVTGEIRLSSNEAGGIRWQSRAQLTELAHNTIGGVKDERLEPAWAHWFTKLKLIKLSVDELIAIDGLI